VWRSRGLVCSAVLLLAGIAAAGEAEGERRAVLPELDLEILAKTSLRLSKAHTALYADRLVALARDVFAPFAPAPEPREGAPTYRVTVEHEGSLEFGERALVREAKGRVFRGGEFVGGGTERRWVLPVRRSCTITVTILRRSGEAHLSLLRFSFKEPQTWDEQLYGGVVVASTIRANGEGEPKCPLRREEAMEKALATLEPAAANIKPQIYKHLLTLRLAQVRPVPGALPADRQRPGFYTAQVSAQNNTPWFLHRFRGKLFARGPRGRTLYCVDLDFAGVIPPGRTRVCGARAAEWLGSERPPWDDLSDLRWSLKGPP